jgi:ankyrin repeat protein
MPPTRPVTASKPPLQDPTLPKNDNTIDDENDGKPLLHVSVENGHEGVVRILIDSGVDVNERDRYEGNTALHIAVWQKNEAVLRLLVESGADVNATDNLGRTPLHQAVATGFEAGLRLLLAHGADINIREKKHTKKRSLG